MKKEENRWYKLRRWLVDKYIKWHCTKAIWAGRIDDDYYCDMADDLMDSLEIDSSGIRKYLRRYFCKGNVWYDD